MNLAKRISTWFYTFKKRIYRLPHNRHVIHTKKIVKRRPLLSFFVLLAILLVLIVIGSIIDQAGRTDEVPERPVKKVTVYRIGESPTVRLQGKIEKAGVVQIVAQSAGIVQKINFTAGSSVQRGQAVVELSTNASGANAGALQAGLAGKQYQLASETLTAQKEIIAKQREVTQKSDENTEELRKISESSLNDTRDLLNQNQDLLNDLDDQIELLESAPQDEDTASALMQLRQARTQLSSGVAQIQGQVRNLEYSTNTENPPTELAILQKDITLKQLDLQEKSLTIQKDIAGIQATLAHISASLMRPASPFNGVVERVNVRVGQSINPGTVIATVSSNEQSIQAIVTVPQSLAQNVSRINPSFMNVNDKKIEIFPKYVTQNATDGQLYSIIYCPPDEYTHAFTDQSFVVFDIPIGSETINTVAPYIPIDAVFQSQDTSYVFIVNGNRAESREVTLGNVYGRHVEVIQGITKDDMVILNRNIINGDQVRIPNN